MGHMSLARVYCDAVARQPEGFTNFHDLDIEWGDPEKYAIIRKIGQGKYSEVFQGKDVSGEEEQDVVLKVLKPVKFQRIKKEIHILQKLRDGPNILQLLDVVRDPETKSPAVVFEYIDAIDLRRTFRRCPTLRCGSTCTSCWRRWTMHTRWGSCTGTSSRTTRCTTPRRGRCGSSIGGWPTFTSPGWSTRSASHRGTLRPSSSFSGCATTTTRPTCGRSASSPDR